jgi:serine/threonine-protein kinase
VEVKQRADALLGKLVGGRYKIVQKLGEGGMGAVYLAEHTGVGQRVAIKFLNPSFSGDPDIVRRFLNEAKSYGQITHPHAVQLHDFGQDDDGNLFISMEFIEGEDLKRTLERVKCFSVKDALDIVLQVCDVLGYAHAKGIVHRDLKPENIMLVKGMRGYHAKVLDFGVARLMAERGTRLTATGSITGTPRYMSPEQAEGKEVDHRTDIYALGLVLFECVTGVHPFSGGTIAETLRKQVLEPVPHLSAVKPELRLGEALDAAIQRAVTKDREQRFPSMQEFAQALVTLVPTSSLDAVPGVDAAAHKVSPEKTAHSRSPYDRDRGGKGRGALVAGAVAVGLIALGIGGYLALRPKPPDSGAAQTTQGVLPPADRDTTVSGSVAPPPVTPTPGPSGQTPDEGKLVAEQGGSTTPVSVTRVVAPMGENRSDPVRAGTAAQVKPARAVGPETGDRSAGGTVAAVTVLTGEVLLAQARNSFLDGNLKNASAIIRNSLDSAAVPQQSAARGRLIDLQHQIDDLNARMQEADDLYRRGRCDQATSAYQAILRLNGGLSRAKAQIESCRLEKPPGVIE